MRKRAAWLGLAFLLMALTGRAWSAAVTLEAKAGLFYPQDKVFREVYKNGLAYGGEITVTLVKGLGLWLGADTFSKNGLTTFTEEPIKIRIIPLYGGLKYLFGRPVRAIRPYLAAAAGYFMYKEDSIIGTVSSGAVGFMGQCGILFRIYGPLSLDVQVRYALCRISPGEETASAQIGGLLGGAGLAVRF